MKITAIKQQVKQPNRYSIYVDGSYSFSLSEAGLLEMKVASGQMLELGRLQELKQLSADNKLYERAVRYAALRQRSEAEMTAYLKRKGSPTPLIEQIVNKLVSIGLVDDQKLTTAFIHDRQLLRPTSRRKILMELRKKRISDEVITAAVETIPINDQTALQQLIVIKRRQTKYQDDQALMKYLSRQGFHYYDIKAALKLPLEGE